MKHHVEELKAILTAVNDNLLTVYSNPFMTKDEKKEAAVFLLNRKNALEFAIKAIDKAKVKD